MAHPGIVRGPEAELPCASLPAIAARNIAPDHSEIVRVCAELARLGIASDPRRVLVVTPTCPAPPAPGRVDVIFVPQTPDHIRSRRSIEQWLARLVARLGPTGVLVVDVRTSDALLEDAETSGANARGLGRLGATHTAFARRLAMVTPGRTLLSDATWRTLCALAGAPVIHDERIATPPTQRRRFYACRSGVAVSGTGRTGQELPGA